MPTTTKAPEPAADERPILYPKVEFHLYDTSEDGEGALTFALMKEYFGMETESEYVARRCEEDPALKKRLEAWEKLPDEKRELTKNPVRFEDKDVIPGYKTPDGERIVFWHNAGNRPIDVAWAKSLGQDQLNRNWAGPLNMPGETVNGEDILIDRYGMVISGQHRGLGFFDCYFRWKSKRESAHWAQLWPEEPVLETGLKTGVSNNFRIIQTLDNTKSRTESDVFATMQELYTDKDTPLDRKILAKMLAGAVALLWDRTRAGEGPDSKRSKYHGYKTTSESCDFLKRHKKYLLQSVRLMFKLDKKIMSGPNKGTKLLADLKLSPGQCACLHFLMSCSGSDYDEYHSKESHEKNEELLDFGNWKKAEQFWGALGKGQPLNAVRVAIADLAKADDEIEGPKTAKKFAFLAKAWALYSEGAAVTADDLELTTATNTDGNEVLCDTSNFGGIDKGPRIDENVAAEDDKEQQEAEAKRIREEKLAEHQNKLAEAAARKAAAKGVSQTVAEPGSGNGKGPGKPPPPALKRPTRKDVEAAQTDKARKADEELEKQKAAAATAPKANGAPTKKQPPKPAGRPKPATA